MACGRVLPCSWVGSCIALVLSAGSADAQTLNSFLEAAHRNNVDAREAETLVQQRTDEEKQMWFRLLPGIGITGSWTNNQYSAIARIALTPGATPELLVLIPPNNFTVAGTLSVPLINAAGWAQGEASSAITEAARADATAVGLNVDRAVIQAFHNVVGARRLVLAASESIDVTQTEVSQTHDRVQAGVASPVDESRARATLAAKQETLANAREIEANAVETLTRVSGLSPDGLTAPPNDSLAEEAPQEEWLVVGLERSPSIKSAEDSATAAAKQAVAGYRAFAPTVSGAFTEQATNATGFTGQPFAYAAGVTLTERFDPTTFEQARALDAAADGARIRVERARLAVHEQIVRDWERVHALIAHARSARARVDANRVAFGILRDRYRAGTTGSLDYQTADQDLFRSQADLIQAEALLATARANLRLSSGLPWNAAGPRDERPR
jgi:outer membrane protein TolC